MMGLEDVESQPGDDEIDQTTYDSLKAAIAAYNVALPEPTPPVDEEKEAIYAILDKADTDVTAGELKTVALTALRRIRRQGKLR
jgi:hypothetical protein